MADVAAAASVSVATVSNVFNTPHLVREATRERVMTVIAELGYQRNEQAYLLRSGSARRPPTTVSTGPGAPDVPSTSGTSDVAPVTKEPETLEDQCGKQETEDWLNLHEGSRVLLVDNREETGAVIDAVMPNGSAFWAWLDGGNGRRLIHRGDGVRVLASFESLGDTDK
ncbi:LacI family DNA-binding transcriptional regulator [Pseudarthrobacter sp. YS3]|uniref:LacI family DNA-binding transcriptional regulator n=1 Tax=Pseudarthrobacter sp. YS3 TaxID=3453718 RepID=UPI003EEF91B7